MLLFQLNLFSFSDRFTFRKCIARIKPSKLQAIRRLLLPMGWADGSDIDEPYGTHFTGLREMWKWDEKSQKIVRVTRMWREGNPDDAASRLKQWAVDGYVPD